jgi:heptosyltransferase-2
MPIENKDVKNILCVRNDRFGEFLLNIPALRALKETFVNARIITVINPYVEDLTKAIPLIDEVIEWDQGLHSFWEKWKFVEALKKRHIDIAVMLNPSKEFNIFTYLAGIPVRVGYARKWDFLLTLKLEDKKYLGKMHEIEYNLELVSLIGAKTDNLAPSLTIENDALNNLLKDYDITESDILIVLHPWTSDPLKQWPLENFRDLADKLLSEPNIKVIIIGGKDEIRKSISFYESVLMQSNLINLTGRTTLRQLGALLYKCNLLISGDSGPVHLGSAVGGRALVVFSNDIPGKGPKRWGPWGQGHIVIAKRSLTDITADEVFNKVKEVLNI